MKSITAVQFRLGLATSEPISPEDKDFYTWLSRTVVGDQCEITERSPGSFVAISNRYIADSKRSAYIYDRFWSVFESAKSSTNVFIVDINSTPGVFRGHLALHLANAVDAAIIELQRDECDTPRHVFILILPDLPPITDSSYTCLAEHIRKGNLVIFSHEGKYDPSERKLYGYSQEQFRLKITASRGNPYEILEKKMICQLGHFSRLDKDKKKICMRHAYDGRFCEKEIVTLLERALRDVNNDASQVFVYYHCPMSLWLINPILALKNKLGFMAYDLGRRKPKHLQPTYKLRPQPTLLVLDLLDSGQMLSQLMDLLKKTGQASDLKIVSILATNPTHPKDHIREYNYMGKLYQIQYFMQAEQQKYPEGTCPLCKMKIPEISAYSEPYNMLTTFDHWAMSIQVGLKNEDDPPNYREALPVVINYLRMIGLYGAWFANKIKDILSILPGKFPADAVIVCPEGEKGSQVLTEYLKMLLEITIIRIPRNVLDSFRSIDEKTKGKLTQISKESPQWYRSLVSIDQYDIIVMDEFNASGQTFEGLRNLLFQLGKAVLCYFSLNDLNPRWSELQSVPVYSLYRWQSYNIHEV